MQEVKITKKQFDKINELQYELAQKYDYISKKVIPDQFVISQDTVFFTYKDKWNYYLCFDGEEIPSGKYKPSSWIKGENMNVAKNSLLESKQPKVTFKITYDNVNCDECDSPNCPYRVVEQMPYYCPRVEECERGEY